MMTGLSDEGLGGGRILDWPISVVALALARW